MVVIETRTVPQVGIRAEVASTLTAEPPSGAAALSMWIMEEVEPAARYTANLPVYRRRRFEVIGVYHGYGYSRRPRVGTPLSFVIQSAIPYNAFTCSWKDRAAIRAAIIRTLECSMDCRVDCTPDVIDVDVPPPK
jgi:hypothetical protein